MTLRTKSILILVLSIIGASLSIYSLVSLSYTITGSAQNHLLCNMSDTVNCDTVNKSHFSHFLGVPLASWGLAFYVYISFIALSIIWDLIRTEFFTHIGIIFGLIGIIGSTILFIISKFYIGTLCPICMGMYIVNFLIGLLFLSENFKKIGLSKSLEFLFYLVKIIIGIKKSTNASQYRFVTLLLLFPLLFSIYLKDVFVLKALNDSTLDTTENITNNQINDQLVTWLNSVELPAELSNNVDNVLGPVDAPVTIIEFYDYECPACAKISSELEKVVNEFPQSTRLIFRQYPLDRECNSELPHEMHQNACFAASLAVCSGKQGKFIEVHKELFKYITALKNGGHYTKDTFRAGALSLARDLKLNIPQLQNCISSQETKQMISRDIKLGDLINLAGTPTMIINGKMLPTPSIDLVREILGTFTKKYHP